jgi:ATP-dependent Lon protease
VILPKRNQLDLEDVPKEITKEMTFVFASTVNEVLKASLEKPVRAVKGKKTKAVKKKND